MSGVTKTYVGYSGGENAFPTYKSVCAGDGHIETCYIEYDESTTSYENLLGVFFEQPRETMMQQYGQYQSVIWIHDEDQRSIVQDKLDSLNKQGDVRASIPKIMDIKDFYIAEAYHQNYETKQVPTLFFLFTILAIDLIPGLPTIMYKAGAIATILFIVWNVYERFLSGQEVKKISKN